MATTTAQIKAWGNSNGIRLNKEILAALGITTNDEVELKVDNQRLIVSPKRRPTLEEMFAGYKGTAESYERSEDSLDWTEIKPVGREVW